MLKNKSEWLKNRIESRAEDYKDFYDNRFVPVLKTLKLFDLYSNYFNSELNDETINALDNFLNLLTSSKNNSLLCESIKHNDKDLENEIFSLYIFMYQAVESFCSYNKLNDNCLVSDKVYTVFNELIIKTYEQKISTLFNKMQKLSNQDLIYIQNQLYSQIMSLIENLTKLVDNYINIDTTSFVMNELVLQEITISESDSKFVVKIFPNILNYFIQTDFYNSSEFTKIKKDIEIYKNSRRTKNKTYWDGLGQLEKKLELLVKNKIHELNNLAGFTTDENNEMIKIIEENFQKYPQLFKILIINSTEQIRKYANYSEATLLKRYTTAVKEIKNLTIRFIE